MNDWSDGIRFLSLQQDNIVLKNLLSSKNREIAVLTERNDKLKKQIEKLQNDKAELINRIPTEHLERKLEPWTDEKQRRSTVNWFERLPKKVALSQCSWERRQSAYAMKKSGMTLRDISDRFLLSQERVRQLIAKAEREKVRHVASPAQQYYAKTAATDGLTYRDKVTVLRQLSVE